MVQLSCFPPRKSRGEQFPLTYLKPVEEVSECNQNEERVAQTYRLHEAGKIRDKEWIRDAGV
jgi:hypothetical protein